MIGAFVVAGFVLAVGVLAVLTQMGATRLSRAPNHMDGSTRDA